MFKQLTALEGFSPDVSKYSWESSAFAKVKIYSDECIAEKNPSTWNLTVDDEPLIIEEKSVLSQANSV